MKSKLIECIPNFSEARRSVVLEKIKNSIIQVKSTKLLDIHSDVDHNRSVFTFIGSPSSVEDSAFNAIKTAAELIDLDTHQGAHPRIGATDVVPFVPLSNASIEDCKNISISLAKKVGDLLNIPVYLYEESAKLPGRKNLEDIRRGQYEGLKATINNDPARIPDYGPSVLGKAGATVIGARHPLIAYNVFLSTGDIDIAKKIARSIRNSSGGLRFVKAMGVLVNGKAQVSMNLTNYEKTPIYRVVELIRSEAARYGTTISSSELVGMIPEKALVDSAKWYLQLNNLGSEQILEHHIYADYE